MIIQEHVIIIDWKVTSQFLGKICALYLFIHTCGMFLSNIKVNNHTLD